MSRSDRSVAILISGRGTNMARLIEAAAEPDYPARIVAVIADVADAPGLRFAGSLGIRVDAVARADFTTREEHEQAVEAKLAAVGAEIVCLAGYMRMLSADFVGRWSGRMINIHPSLLPSFKGLDTHRRALEAGVRVHGCSVHFVESEMDGGPIIAQAAVPVRIEDDEERLAARVLKAEHRLYPLALKLVAEGRARLENGRTVFEAGDMPEREADRSLIVPEFEEAARSIEDLARFTP